MENTNIEIHNNDLSGCNGFTVIESETGKVLARNIFEDTLVEVLSEQQFEQFTDGAFAFTVDAWRF